MADTTDTGRGLFQSPMQIGRDLHLAMLFLTRLPLPQRPHAPADYLQAVRAFPVAGALIGLIAGAVYVIARWIGLDAMVAAALTLAASAALTGALHEDALGDAMDGIGGGKTPEEKLAIMHDSRLGSYGVTALVLVLLLKWILIVKIGEAQSAWTVLLALAAAGAISRAGVAFTYHHLPLAREDGLAASLGQPARMIVVDALILAVLLSLVTLPLWAALVAWIAAIIVTWCWTEFVRGQINGLTGDILGAGQLLTECGVLIVVVAL